jgi:hypothetical protein
MSDSILDKVISIKEDQEKQDFNAVGIVDSLLAALAPKEADVVRRRHGLTEKGKETLENIGQDYNVTRERIRQIENQSLQKMRDADNYKEVVGPAENTIVHILNEHGGAIEENMLYDNLLAEDQMESNHPRYISFIVTNLLPEKVEPLPKKKKYDRGWKLKHVSIDYIDALIDALHEIADGHGVPQAFDELHEKMRNHETYMKHEENLTENAIQSLLHVAGTLDKNPYEEYGLREWGHIKPKRMHDRVFLVLRKEGDPMHFEEIAERITKVFEKKAYPPTVHNELILNDEYVLVGRGIYALKEWGFKEGVVSSVIEDVIKDAGKPLSRKQIIDTVLEQRMVKKNTIMLALTDKSRFKKTTDGKYTLADA